MRDTEAGGTIERKAGRSEEARINERTNERTNKRTHARTCVCVCVCRERRREGGREGGFKFAREEKVWCRDSVSVSSASTHCDSVGAARI